MIWSVYIFQLISASLVFRSFENDCVHSQKRKGQRRHMVEGVENKYIQAVFVFSSEVKNVKSRLEINLVFPIFE